MVTVKQPFPIFTDAYFEHNVKLIRKYVKRIVQHHSTNVLHARKANVKFPPCTFAINFLSLFLPLETDRHAGANRCKNFFSFATIQNEAPKRISMKSFPFPSFESAKFSAKPASTGRIVSASSSTIPDSSCHGSHGFGAGTSVPPEMEKRFFAKQ